MTHHHLPAGPGASAVPANTMVVFCHLRWDFVFQRPQQLLSRLARHFRILVVEEPVFHEGPAFLKRYSPVPNITVCQPHTPLQAPGFHDDQIAMLHPLLSVLVPKDTQPVVWFYTPMALPLLRAMSPGVIVYDCMDELSAFRNAPRQLLQRETALLNMADVVFTGGPSLHEAKRARHPNAHCFPSSVDVQHFSRALDRSTAHPSQQALRRPRLGYYGVIDERFDAALLQAVAETHPEWDLVMVGPVVKIDPETLPRHANIHYMGQASYEELPQYLAAWDVCLMPFALNESTRFISPTKVLEYMAAELPIVSTNITDVTRPYGDVVRIAYTTADFIQGCEEALALPAARRAAMAATMRAVVRATSWDLTAERMRALIKTGESPALGDVQVDEEAGAAVNGLRSSSKLPLHKMPATVERGKAL